MCITTMQHTNTIRRVIFMNPPNGVNSVIQPTSNKQERQPKHVHHHLTEFYYPFSSTYTQQPHPQHNKSTSELSGLVVMNDGCGAMPGNRAESITLNKNVMM